MESKLGGPGSAPARQRRGLPRAGSAEKWLQIHGIEHWTHFYTDYGRELQQRFFDHFLKGEDNGWESQPPVQLNIRYTDGTFTVRAEQEWPLARTSWTTVHLDATGGDAARRRSRPTRPAPATATFDALGDGVTFLAAPFESETELTGPLAARLYVSSSPTRRLVPRRAALLADRRRGDVPGRDRPAHTDRTGMAAGVAPRAHEAESTPYRPYHPHTSLSEVRPGEATPSTSRSSRPASSRRRATASR